LAYSLTSAAILLLIRLSFLENFSLFQDKIQITAVRFAQPIQKERRHTPMKHSSRLVKSIVAAVASLMLVASIMPIALAEASTDSTLAALASTQALSPAFDAGTKSYTVLLPVGTDSETLTPTAATGATFTIDGIAEASHTYTLASINTPITSTIVVTAEDGVTQTTYTVAITRVGPARLLSLGISAGTLAPAFDPAKFGTHANPYVLSLAEGTPSATFTPHTSNPADKVFANGRRVLKSSFVVSVLNGQSKRLNITVMSPVGYANTYFFTVTRAKSTNADLKKLSVNVATGMNPAFSAAVTDYSVTVPASRSSVVVTAKAAGYGATVTINGKRGPARVVKIKNGATTDVVVVVTPQDKTAATKTYTIHLTQTLRVDRFYAAPRVLKLASGTPITFYYKLDGASDNTVLEINCGGGWQQLMARADAAGSQSFQWDGTVGSTKAVAGTYQVRLSASWNGLAAASRIITVGVK